MCDCKILKKIYFIKAILLSYVDLFHIGHMGVLFANYPYTVHAIMHCKCCCKMLHFIFQAKPRYLHYIKNKQIYLKQNVSAYLKRFQVKQL